MIDEFRDEPYRYSGEISARLLASPDREAIVANLNPTGWNAIRVEAHGPRIRLSLNGVLTAEYTEDQPVPRSGRICLQAHSGEPSHALYREVVIRTR